VQHQGSVQVIHARVTSGLDAPAGDPGVDHLDRPLVLHIEHLGPTSIALYPAGVGALTTALRVERAFAKREQDAILGERVHFSHHGEHLILFVAHEFGRVLHFTGELDDGLLDIVYHEPLGPQRLAELEEIVNRKIVENHPVRAFTTTMDHARDLGAMALFGEKYGDFVRLVEIDDFSRELCGGTHVGSTSEIGIFKILSEASVGANVRRIEAVTGRRAVEYYRHRDELLTQAAAATGAAQEEAIVGGIEKLRQQAAGLKQEITELMSGKAVDIVRDVAGGATEIAGVRVAVAAVEVRDADQLVSVLDQVRDKLGSAVVALGAVIDGKAMLLVAVSKGLISVDAGRLVKIGAGVFGGGGGGSATLGRAGGGDPAHLEAALAAVRASAAEALEG